MQKQFSTPVRKSASFRTSRRYEQPTIASKSRSPSPYTNRRMCELSEDSKQRLTQFNLGPHTFKRETEDKPPFVVRHMETSQSPDTSMMVCSTRECSRGHNDLSALDSHRPSHPQGSHRMHIDDLQMSLDSLNDPMPLETESGAASPYRSHFSRSAPSSVLRHPPSPVLNRSSLRERFQSDHRASANWEEIHSRVKNILRTHSARQRLVFDKTDTWKEPHSNSVGNRTSLSTKELHDGLPNTRDTSVHLDNGEFWCNKASAYKGKSHRVIFQESMEKIYKDMYRNSLSPHTYRRSHNS
ncbi:spermatogenesis-associated protein 6 isoform X1 [Rana temporaria]|uniref:spermatogenesis-associated protein 6 isoform X1 n=2 Tax=Rana temporaria TaxID=8407 RepID=UPI001AAC88EA|nr:spermatogenesis-associated protein 6 isoform X1 [Rana temporaria]XP_040216463.1 spermatogenesis-associated protein 6 isoform X1 [Rana temporaria]